MTNNNAYVSLDRDVNLLSNSCRHWVETSVSERITILSEIKECVMPVAESWVRTAAAKKGIKEGSSLEGEEWITGPYTLLGYCNELINTLSNVKGKKHISALPVRELPNGQIAVRVAPRTLWDHLLLSGVKVDVWMQAGVTRDNLGEHTASLYDPGNPEFNEGGVALVLGAGNISSIAPLDVFQKLFAENEVVILKLNPINEYLFDFFEAAFKPLIERSVLRIVRGGIDVGEYLCKHPKIKSIHITGSVSSHDAIVWGVGDEAASNKVTNTPKNTRRITSELGAVCPTIVVPGPFSKSDLQFQSEQIATQKLHNSGFNCVACQVLVVPRDWSLKGSFLESLRKVIRLAEGRPLYYPNTSERLAEFKKRHPKAELLNRASGEPVLLASLDASEGTARTLTEVFGPAMNIVELPSTADVEQYLRSAIQFANEQLYGTLGANIIIHPKTIAAIGRQRLEEILQDLRYGTIAINAWTGVAFLSPMATWGAFPGHSLQDIQSGIGVVHNTNLFERPERTVVEAPFRPFPRNLLSLSFSLLPRPPWFITNKRGAILGRLLVVFNYRPSLLKLPRIFFHALLG